MTLVKKLTFAPLFITFFGFLIYSLTPLLSAYDFIFSFSLNNLIQLMIIAALLTGSGLFFSVFVTLAADWKLILPVSLLAAFLPMLILEPALALVFSVMIFVGLLLTFVALENSLKDYLTFKPEALLGPAIRRMTFLLIPAFCVIFFLSTNRMIAQKGFQIPDSLIDTALKMVPLETPAEEETPVTQLPAINPEQLELLKQNPELLRQSGLDPKILDALNQSNSAKTPQNLTQNLIKQTVKDQMQNLIKPYTNFIPAGLTLMLFLSLLSLVSMVNLLIYPFLWVIFYLLEKTNFVKFTIEQRPVKKLVI